MNIYKGFPDSPLDRPSFLTIGSFDGVHRGHQELIARLVGAAHDAGCLAGVLTFDPHPMAVLRPDAHMGQLTSVEERAHFIAALGVDFMLVLYFTRATASTSASDFMQALVDHLRLQELWVGPDFALGRGREGNVERLAELGRETGYAVRVVPPFDLAGGPVRSSRVRSLLAEDGDADQAAALLGRPYQMWGTVESGARRGRSLGYPTANLSLPTGRLAPAFGVYACWAWLAEPGSTDEHAGKPAAVSVGVRPTFDNGQPTIEAYLLDFDGDLYGQTLGLSFISRLRPELRFHGADALIAQMERDVQRTRELLSNPPFDAVAGQDGWTELSHTADWAIKVDGESLGRVFARAAAGMYYLQDVDASAAVTLARSFAVRASDPADLMVAWLNRLLLAQELHGEMYTHFRIFEISECGLNAVAYGHPGAPLHTGVKAVTYYDLQVTETDEGWMAVVTFDV